MRKYVMGFILLAAPLLGVGCSEHHYNPYAGGYYGGGPYYPGGVYGPRYPGNYRVYRPYRRDHDLYPHDRHERHEAREHEYRYRR